MPTSISGRAQDISAPNYERASANFARLITHVANLYRAGDSSTVSIHEAYELAMSVAYTIGISDARPEEAARVLDVEDPVLLWRNALSVLDARMEAALILLGNVVATMPPIRNVSLRDTLASLEQLRFRYDTWFAAHEIPCDIQYQLSKPVDPDLIGIDYIEAWLEQLMSETRWIARFDVESCIAVLERVCPDYRGLHVNLYGLLFPHEGELVPVAAKQSASPD